MKNRIERILREEKIASSKFADEIGIQRSSMSHILSGRNNPSLDITQRVLRKFPHINSDWLILGVGDMYDKTTNNLNLFDTEEEADISLNVSDVNLPEIEETANKEPQIDNITPKEVNQAIVKDKKIKKIMVFYTDGSFEEITKCL